MESRGREALEEMAENLKALPRIETRLRGHNLLGIEALRGLFDEQSTSIARPDSTRIETEYPSLLDLVDQIAAAERGLIMVLGKGGVGKTTIAAAIAVELASRGLPVHLTTTDPAAHVAETIDAAVPNLRLSRIDPQAETETYRRHVMETKGKDLDEQARALLEEDLLSSCTEEVAVFHAFSRLVREAKQGFVVMDTAPTGHTLLLLDATGAYHREIVRNVKGNVGKTVTPLMRLQDPDYTKMLIVTLPETTPILEAAQLQQDLRRAQIEPWAWVVNGSLAAAGPADPLLVMRAESELPLIDQVSSQLASRLAVVPWVPLEPVGFERLRQLAPARSLIAQS